MKSLIVNRYSLIVVIMTVLAGLKPSPTLAILYGSEDSHLPLRMQDSKWHNKGLVELLIRNDATFGFQNACIWPKESGESYIFGAGIWVGAMRKIANATAYLVTSIDDTTSIIFVDSTASFDSVGAIKIENELIYYRGITDTSFIGCVRGFAKTSNAFHLSGALVEEMRMEVTCGYNPSNGQTEFTPPDFPNYTDNTYRVYMSDNPADTADWPVRDATGNPIIISNQDSYCFFNDADSSRHRGGGRPLGIEVSQIGYSWNYDIYKDFIFLSYYIVNKSPDTLFNVHVGVCCDADIGDATDDLVEIDAGRDLGYAYDSDFNEPGWSHIPGYMGFDFLESPLDTAGQRLGLTALKITTITTDAGDDREAYLLLAGYNFKTQEYHPWDSISTPQDIRFVQCTGPFTLGSGDTGKVVIAVVMGTDSIDFRNNDDVAQQAYDMHFATHKVKVLSPNGGEEVDSTITITWQDSSATGDSLLIDIFYSRNGGESWNTIATGIPDLHSYEWNTLEVPDGTKYLIKVYASDGVTIGEDVSNGIFIINNPGNGVPDITFVSPNRGTIQKVVPILWEAADADHDTLSIDIFYRHQYQTTWIPISTGEENDSEYLWNTYLFHSGNYYLKVVTRDADTSSADTSDGYVQVLNDHPPAGPVIHTAGGCNSLSIQALEYDSSSYTGHYYETKFKLIQKIGSMDPLYTYDLYDATIDSFLLVAQPLSTKLDGALYVDYSPVIDGFALQFDTQIDRNSFGFVEFFEVINVNGFDGVLEIGSPQPPATWAWAFRGSDYELHWVKYAPDTTKVTLEVHDLTNGVIVPFRTVIGDNWYIGSQKREFLEPTQDKYVYLCSDKFWFNENATMIIPPGAGDIWKITSSGAKVPCDGNVYTFAVGVEEKESAPAEFILNQNIPDPFSKQTNISYSVKTRARVSLKIYDLTGRLVQTLVDEYQSPGYYKVRWNGRNSLGRKVASGVYFYRLGAGDFTSNKKMVTFQ